jgi:hypothetical protein
VVRQAAVDSQALEGAGVDARAKQLGALCCWRRDVGRRGLACTPSHLGPVWPLGWRRVCHLQTRLGFKLAKCTISLQYQIQAGF